MRKARRLPIEELTPYLFPDTPRGEKIPPIDWKQLFGNDHPIEIEVGFGKGLFLLTASEAKPETNFFGIEIIRKYQLFTATRLALRKRSNVKVAWADARALLREAVAPASVDALHIYFPDPWWKTRHHKHRVFTTEFAQIVSQLLKIGGLFYIATDVEEYFQVQMGIVRPMPEFRELPPPTEKPPEHEMDYLTNYERKFRKEGKPIHRAIFERVEVRNP